MNALNLYLQVEAAEKSDDREWQMKMALLTADPDRFGPVIFPAAKEEQVISELQPGDLTMGGFHPDITVKYARVPTPEEVEQTLANFPQEMLLGADDFQFAKDERLANGRHNGSH